MKAQIRGTDFRLHLSRQVSSHKLSIEFDSCCVSAGDKSNRSGLILFQILCSKLVLNAAPCTSEPSLTLCHFEAYGSRAQVLQLEC